MKLELSEVHFLRQAVDNVTIQGKDATGVAVIIDKLSKEFIRLQKAEDKKQAAAPMVQAAK